MNDEEPVTQPDSNEEPFFVAQFRHHLTDIHAHLLGAESKNLRPSYVPPTGYWTAIEKETFFHSLCIHSRLRPDLIAASIGTKTVLDVCTYIDLLDDGLSEEDDHLLSRSDFGTALEVSDAWVRHEESMAEELMSVEPAWEQALLLSRREEELLVQNTHPQISTFNDEAASHDLDGGKTSIRTRWSQEDTLSCLDVYRLSVMDRLLNQAESAGGLDEHLYLENSSTGPVQSLSPPHLQPPGQTPTSTVVGGGVINPILPFTPKVSAFNQSLQEGCSSHVQIEPQPHVDHPLIDPHPTRESRSCSPMAIVISQSKIPPGNQETVIDASNLSPASRRKLRKRLYMRRKRAAERGENAIIHTNKLRPGRRDKEKKMSKPGDVSGSMRAVDKERVGDDHEIGPPSLDSHQAPDAGEEAEHDEVPFDAHYRSKGGMTKPSKAKAEFLSKRITADVLVKGSLGLFHMLTLGRLMRVYKSGYGVQNLDTVSSISADTIRLLTAIILEYTSEVVRRAIISREQEIILKKNSKVHHFTHDNEITVGNIYHALEMMGMSRSKATYFADLVGESALAPEDGSFHSDDAEEDDGDDEGTTSDDENILSDEQEDVDNEDELESDTESDTDDQVEVGDVDEWEGLDGGDEVGSNGDDDNIYEDEGVPPEGTVPPTLFSHRDIYPPFVHLPRSLLSEHVGKPNFSIAHEGFLMPADTDEEALLAELKEEMELDNEDEVASHKHEADLWNQVKKSSLKM